MLIDADQLPGHSEIHCDVCVAGSGPVGLTIATELARASLRVCLVESGGLSARSSAPAPSVAEQLGVPVDHGKFEQLCIGGASNRWGGVSGRWFRLKPMDPIDFEVRPWVANSGWPFGYEELKPFLDRARTLLNGSGTDLNADAHGKYLAPAFHNDQLQTTIFQMVRPLRFGRDYRSLLSLSHNIQLYFHARVVEIEEDSTLSRVCYFHIATNSDRKHRISARHFVLACGGLENPRLLLASKRNTASGIGNRHDLVGRYYMQHPKGLHGVAVLNQTSLRSPLYTGGYGVDGVKIGGAISFSEEYQRREEMLNHCIMFRPIFSLSESHASQAYRALCRAWQGACDGFGWQGELLNFSKSAAGAVKLVSKGFGLRTVFGVMNHMEQIPKRESRVELSEQRDRFGVNQLRIDWRIDSAEKASLRRLHKLVRERLATGGGTVESQLELLADWPVSHDSAHHIGTTRMHADRRWGVTDLNCRVHGVQNLYIGGSSVLPTSGNANPTLTIVALAARLADHLKSVCLSRPVTARRDTFVSVVAVSNTLEAPPSGRPGAGLVHA